MNLEQIVELFGRALYQLLEHQQGVMLELDGTWVVVTNVGADNQLGVVVLEEGDMTYNTPECTYGTLERTNGNIVFVTPKMLSNE